MGIALTTTKDGVWDFRKLSVAWQTSEGWMVRNLEEFQTIHYLGSPERRFLQDCRQFYPTKVQNVRAPYPNLQDCDVDDASFLAAGGRDLRNHDVSELE